MASFAGLRHTDDYGTDERPKSFRELILWKNPNGTSPIFALSSKFKTEATSDPEYSWWQELLGSMRVTINYGTGYISTDNTLTVDARSGDSPGGLDLVPNDLLMVEKAESASYDNELVLVSSVTSDTVIVVKRGQAGSTAAAIADDAALLKIGSAFAEGTVSPNISQRNPTKLYNYTQIFKHTCGASGTTLATRTRTGDPWKNDRKRKSFDHAAAIEWALMFGRRYETTDANGDPLRFMGGLRSFISTNVTVFSTTPTEDTLLAAVYPVFNYNSNGAGDERIVFCGNGFLNSVNKLARNSNSTRVNFNGGIIDIFGMKLQTWVFPQGRIAIKSHPLMNQHPIYTYSAFVLDPTGIIYRPLRGRDTMFKDNVQENDRDGRKGQWLTECGLEVEVEETMAYLGNFVV